MNRLSPDPSCGDERHEVTMFHLIRFVPWMVLAMSACSVARAATVVCVDSATALQAALTASQSDGDDNYIYVVAGSYSLATGLTFVSNEDRSLVIVGGYDPACSDPHGGQTILDGQHSVRPLYVASGTGHVLIYRMTIAGGYSDASGGGLVIASHGGNVNVIYSEFVGNRSADGGGALYAKSDSGSVFVFGNLVYGNRALQVGGVVVEQGGTGQSYVVNNTIFGNIGDTLSVPAGLFATGTAHFRISNNVVWNNAAAGGSDFGTLSPHSRRSNDIGTVAVGATPDVLTGELSVEPQFVSCGFLCINFRLAATSPLIDAGSDTAIDELNGIYEDIDFRPRTIGLHVDIGAYENDALFANGFDL